jgi:hypothetical protein
MMLSESSACDRNRCKERKPDPSDKHFSMWLATIRIPEEVLSRRVAAAPHAEEAGEELQAAFLQPA